MRKKYVILSSRDINANVVFFHPFFYTYIFYRTMGYNTVDF